jgi:hypothetical protein
MKLSDGAGSLVRRQTILLQVMGDGRLMTNRARRRFVTEDWNFRTRSSVREFQD